MATEFDRRNVDHARRPMLSAGTIIGIIALLAITAFLFFNYYDPSPRSGGPQIVPTVTKTTPTPAPSIK
jgi:hypothetical protein